MRVHKAWMYDVQELLTSAPNMGAELHALASLPLRKTPASYGVTVVKKIYILALLMTQ